MGGLSASDLRRPLSFPDRISILWLLVDGFTHLTIEALYLFFALGPVLGYGPDARSSGPESPFAFIWKEYARADLRWDVSDPVVISLEILTVFGAGPLALVGAYGIWARRPWRHLILVCLSVAELYGGWMTFAPEWVQGSPLLRAEPWYLLWIYLVFMNGLWVVFPLLLIVDSGNKIVRACEIGKIEGPMVGDKSCLPGSVWSASLLTLVAYIVLVPLILYLVQ